MTSTVATLPPHPILDAPLGLLEAEPDAPGGATPGVVVPDVIAAPTWPCTTCGERVDLELPTCPTCGGRFLAAVTGEPVLTIPGIGGIGTLSTSAKVALMAGGSVVLIGVLVLLSFLLGSLL